MVERHIFSPQHAGKGVHKSPMSLKLEKALIFTGVIISSQGKWAIIRETQKMNEEKVSGLRKEGDEIMGMVIKKIGRNYLILAEEGKEIRLNLYQEGKLRPSMPTGSKSASGSAEKVSTDLPDASSQSTVPEAETESIRPNDQIFKPQADIPEEEINAFPPDEPPSSQETPPNPFIQPNPNPVQPEAPANPFLPKTPPSPNQEQAP